MWGLESDGPCLWMAGLDVGFFHGDPELLEDLGLLGAVSQEDSLLLFLWGDMAEEGEIGVVSQGGMEGIGSFHEAPWGVSVHRPGSLQASQGALEDLVGEWLRGVEEGEHNS